MTIDEAIEYVDDVNSTVSWREGQEKDEALFDNLPNWLQALKDYRDSNKWVVKIDCLNLEEVKTKIQEVYQQGKADVIDEFVDELIKPSNYERFDFDDCLDSSDKANDFFKYVFAMAEKVKNK